MDKLKVAIIGLGSMGKNHARACHELEQTDLVGVYDIDLNITNEVAKKHETKAYRDIETMLKEAKPDFVNIVTPTSTHSEMAIKVLEYTNVLLEKPIAINEQAALKIIQKEKETGKKLMIGHIERYNPAITYLKDFIKKSNEELLALTIVRLGISPPKNCTSGVVTDLAIHDIDLVRYLTQEEVTSCDSLTKSFGLTKFEDHAHIFLKTQNCSASLISNWINPRKIRNLSATLKNSYVYINLLKQEIELFEKNNGSTYNPFDCSTTKIQLPKAEPLKLEILDFINCIKNNKEPTITAEDALETLKVALKA